MVFLYIIIGYFIFIWIILRLIVPHLGFKKESIAEHLPAELENTIAELNRKALSDREFLDLAYQYVTGKYRGGRTETLTKFWRAFGNMYTKTPGFLPCTAQNFILRTILVKSGRFAENDIIVKTVPLNLFVHQYLKVNVDGAWTEVDPWSHFKGVPIGKKTAYIG